MNNETIEIKKSNVLASYEEARKANAAAYMKFLENLFGKELFKPKDVRDRIKTFEDAMMALGEDHPLVREWHLGENLSPDLEAYLQLRVIVAALNEGWEPQFTEDEERYYPWHWLYTRKEIDNMEESKLKERNMVSTEKYQTDYAGFAFANSIYAPSYSYTAARIGSRLCLKSDALAEYCGKQFTDIWADFLLIRK
jgi:hypothetical protein